MRRGVVVPCSWHVVAGDDFRLRFTAPVGELGSNRQREVAFELMCFEQGSDQTLWRGVEIDLDAFRFRLVGHSDATKLEVLLGIRERGLPHCTSCEVPAGRGKAGI